ncbi:MAG: amidinotransferase [Acidobacteria bacterium]|nr:amidinotransferase [Acidobacteriota bacterium]
MEKNPAKTQCAPAILMVRPYDFDFNEETGIDNEFQKRISCLPSEINQKAMQEFEVMVETLGLAGIDVVVLERSLNEWKKTPDAVFPNNWLSTEPDGTLITFPMYAENRRAEKRIDDVEHLLVDRGFYIRNLINIGRHSERTLILEGTGSMVIDHLKSRVYAARSFRCHPEQFENFVQVRNYAEGILFDTLSSTGKPIYHTNVMMSIGQSFAVICDACVAEWDRPNVMEKLAQDREIISISFEQMERHFCGNILQVRNREGEWVTVMSERAMQGFEPFQIKRMEQHGRILPVRIPTIEAVGGGSARCMMAELFLPRRAERVPMHALGA